MSSLSHHGIKGQKWGVRRYQNKDGTLTREGQIRFTKKNLKHAKVRNLDKWGKSPDSNVLYIIGTSGSGKSTTAKGLAEDGDQVIHLDTIFEKENHGSPDSNKDFEAFLKENNVDITKASDFSIPKEERWQIYDAMGDLVEAYGQHCFTKGSKVVIEGVQMGDQTLYPDKNYFNGKPTVVLKGNIVRDTFRADRRDGVPLRKTVVRLTDKERWNWYKQVNATSNAIKYTSIGGTMYIEGNALILGDSSYLEHHGVLGQKWGVRRFQNKDGTRTALGKKQLKAKRLSKNEEGIRDVYRSLSDEDFRTLGYSKEEADQERKDDFLELGRRHTDYDQYNRVRYKDGKAVGYIAATGYQTTVGRGKKIVNILAVDLAVHSEYRGNGYSVALGKDLVRWFDTYGSKEYDRMEWYAMSENIGSQKAAERSGFTRRSSKEAAKGWVKYRYDKKRKLKHTSIGGTMYIEGNALILGDSSYLKHHGIRGQRWGVRRFQNRDGSLTNAGRKRLGYATKGVTQTVGKAFKAGVKAGGNAVKAVKAHHEKAEAKKKEKKKEKASKTRLGVMANKDLFTNEEIRKLNERFKLEDEMKMATLQKGVEIAKAVGTIAQNVGTMAKAYEDVTGQSLSPIKRKAAEEKAKQDAEDRKRKLAKEDAETKRAEDKEKRDIEDRERRIKLEDEDRVRKQAKEDADAQRAENAEKRAQAKEQRDSTMAVELQRKAKAAADEQEHKAVKAKAESRSAILDVLEKIDKIQDHDDDDHNNPPGGGIDTWNDDDYLNFFKKTGIIHSDISDPSIIQNGVLFIDSSDSLAHHGVKGQKWGVRRFQNEDGSLTDKGRKHYEKALAKEKRKQASSDAIRGTLERQHPFAVTGSAILGAVAAGMSIAATGGASAAAIAAGSAISAAVSAGLTHATYSVSEAWEGRGTRMRSKKIAKYENMLKQSSMEEGMYHVENGTLFINAGEPYLEHHGVKGMKWGKHLMVGKGEAGAGGGSGEDDEKLKEMAKKAGMSVAEYRTKMAGKLSGAASKVGEKVYDAAGGSHKKNAEGWRKMAQEESNAARASERSSHENSARAASQDRKYGSGGDVYRRAADSDKENAETHRSNAKGRSERAASEQAAYEKSLAGKYDKMKADLARSKKMKQRQSIERALSNGPVEAKPKKGLGKRLEEKLGVTHERTNKPKQSKEAKRIEGMFKDAARKDKAFSGTSPKEKKRLKDVAGELYGSKHRKDFERNARLLEGSTRSAVEIGRDTYKRHGPTSGFGDPTYKATDDAYKRANKQWNNARVAGQKYDRSIAKRVDSLTRKASKARKRRAKHFDDTNAVYTEGTRLVINSKWG